MKISVVITVKNEEAHIVELLHSLQNQTLQPNEVIIVDANSTDSTPLILSEWKKVYSSSFVIRILSKDGNRSVGRNFGISQAKNEWIAITDAGCVPKKKWLAELVKEQAESECMVIAGYAKGITNTNFGKAVVPFVLVMPDAIDPANYLPATRSVLLHRSVWKKMGGFPEWLTVSEDFYFFRKVKTCGISMSFSKHAEVGWYPRNSLVSFFKMLFSFAQWDIRAGVVRLGAVSVLGRYAGGLLLFWIVMKLVGLENTTILFGLLYICYLSGMTVKRLNHVGSGWYFVPLLQVVADGAVILGTVSGIIAKLRAPIV